MSTKPRPSVKQKAAEKETSRVAAEQRAQERAEQKAAREAQAQLRARQEQVHQQVSKPTGPIYQKQSAPKKFKAQERPSVRDGRKGQSLQVPRGEAMSNVDPFSDYYRENRNANGHNAGYGNQRVMAAHSYKKRGTGHAIMRVIGVLVTIVVLFAVVGLGYLTVTEYRPSSSETIDIQQTSEASVPFDESIDLLTWNIGYCGLSSDMDYFLDGGSDVRAKSTESVQTNLSSIESLLDEQDADVVFLQEVDKDSDRTFNVDESKSITESLGSQGYSSAFATNFKANFIPYPFPSLLGKMESGLQTESKFKTESAERISLSDSFSWPINTCNMKRCLLVERINIAGTSKQLVLINAHLEAYDDDNAGKQAQTEELMELMQVEYSKGNYVIAGGDFNQTFSKVNTMNYPLTRSDLWQPGKIDESKYSDFQFVMDSDTATCRSLDRVYDGSSDFQLYMVDGFIVSSNIQIDEVKTIDAGFENSDHNPVKLSFTLLSSKLNTKDRKGVEEAAAAALSEDGETEDSEATEEEQTVDETSGETYYEESYYYDSSYGYDYSYS